MRKIVAIGGGDLTNMKDTLDFDKEIISLTKKKKPTALFLPTASSDDDEYYEKFKEIYGKELGCKTDVLKLLNEDIEESEIKDKILGADLIYVGEGNSLMMMRKFRFTKASKWLARAEEAGTVLCGISAGALCWFEYGHSDSMAYYQDEHGNMGGKKVSQPSEGEEWDFIRVKCLGFVDKITICPHYQSPERQESFKKMIRSKGGVGIGLYDRTALELVDNDYRILSTKKGAKAIKLFKNRKGIVEEELEASNEFSNFYELLWKGQ